MVKVRNLAKGDVPEGDVWVLVKREDSGLYSITCATPVAEHALLLRDHVFAPRTDAVLAATRWSRQVGGHVYVQD
jgi:hypothetical protein